MLRETRSVSVVIPVYNSAATLRRAVESVLCQTLTDLELLIVDDASPDTSGALALELAAQDARIRVISLPENRGKSFAMNRAIEDVSGRWVAVLDADDWYEPDRLHVLVATGESHDVPLAADNQMLHDAGVNVAIRAALPVERGDRPLDRLAFIAGSDPYAGFNLGMLKPIVRTDFIRRTDLAYRENVRLSEDFLYLVDFLAATGTGVLVARPLYNWTQPFGEVSRRWTTTGAGAWRYDFGAAIAVHEEVSRELRDRRQHDLADLLAARAKAFRTLHHLNEISREVAIGASVPRILGSIARHPSLWPQLARRALHTLPRRISG
jgi:succinoglycan biosynthesis protein ExoO